MLHNIDVFDSCFNHFVLYIYFMHKNTIIMHVPMYKFFVFFAFLLIFNCACMYKCFRHKSKSNESVQNLSLFTKFESLHHFFFFFFFFFLFQPLFLCFCAFKIFDTNVNRFDNMIFDFSASFLRCIKH